MKKIIKKILRPGIRIVALILSYSGATRLMTRYWAYKIYTRLPSRFRGYDTVVNYRGAKLKINTGDTDGKIIRYMDALKPVETSFFESLLGPGMLVYDVGAKIGILTALAIKHGAKVIAFEPDPTLCHNYILPTVQMNRGSHLATIVPAGVSDTKGTFDFWIHREGNFGAGRVYNGGFYTNGQIVKVPMDTLDSYMNQYGKPQLVKIHIEGAEVLAIRGSQKIFEGPNAPILVIEFHVPDIEAIAPGTTYKDLIVKLQGYGYKVATLTEPKYRESEWHIFYKGTLPQRSLRYFTPKTQVPGGYMVNEPIQK